jgi:outer membrane protein assembly factor BamB
MIIITFKFLKSQSYIQIHSKVRRKIMRLAICSILLLILSAPVYASDWMMFKKDESHSGFTSDTVKPPLVLKWTYNLLSDTDSSPVIVNDVLYIGSNYGIHAIDAKSGKEIWTTPTNGFVKGVPAVVDGTLYIGPDEKRFYAIDTKDGSIKWTFKNSTDGYLSSPVVVNNLVYAGSKDGTLYAINIKTGQLSWMYLTGKDIESSPSVVDGTVFFGNDDNNVFALDGISGIRRWIYNTGTSIVISSPAVFNGIVYIGSNDGNIYALNATNGAVKWKYQTGNNVETSPSVHDGIVYAGSKDSNFFALDAETGRLIWQFPTAGFVYSSSATISNDVVYFGSKGNMIYSLDAKTGELLWRNSTGVKDKDDITTPAISGDTLYVATHSGLIYAYTSERPEQTVSITSLPTPTPVVPIITTASKPVQTTQPPGAQKTPGFEYADAGLIFLITVFIRKRFFRSR